MTKYTETELALLGHSAHVWLKLLKAREKRILDKIYGEFNAGRTDFLALITEYSVVRSQTFEIEQTLNQQSAKGV